MYVNHASLLDILKSHFLNHAHTNPLIVFCRRKVATGYKNNQMQGNESISGDIKQLQITMYNTLLYSKKTIESAADHFGHRLI